MKLREMRDVPCPMRDGVHLSLNVFRPDDDRRYPAILLRTPYLKERIDQDVMYAWYPALAESGYNMVFQDVRGTGGSGGVLDPTGAGEIEDGYDSVEWIAAQPWCDGRVGMQGLSYFGFTQVAAAALRPPHLKATCPFQNGARMPFSMTRAGTIGQYHLLWVCDRALENLERWVPDATARESARAALEDNKAHWQERLRILPLLDTPVARIEGLPQLHSYLELVDGIENRSRFLARAKRPVPMDGMPLPMFFLTGWFDGARDGTIDNWQQAVSGATVPGSRKLLIGPWLHGGNLDAAIDGIDFGVENSGRGIGIEQMVHEWFDAWLKDVPLPWAEEPPVRVFVLGRNEWRSERTWPPESATPVKYHLHPGATARHGGLATKTPLEDTRSHFVYDPENPLPSRFADANGRTVFADPTAQEDREDVLTYVSEPLEREMVVAGMVECVLHAATDGWDTDFFCRVCDVDEQGVAFPLLSGMVRCRFRDGDVAKLLTPGEIHQYTIEVGNICNAFRAGHRIKVHISSSFYPEHDPNPNTPEPIGHSTWSRIARQTVCHGPQYPSYLVLPVMPAE